MIAFTKADVAVLWIVFIVIIAYAIEIARGDDEED